MRTKLFFYFFISTCFISTAFAQKKIYYSVSTRFLLPITNDITSIHKSNDQYDPNILYWKRKKNTKPFYNLILSAKTPVTKKINIGIQSGIQMHNNETHFIGIKRNFLAIPFQVTTDFILFETKKSTIGLSGDVGFLFYKIDDYVYKIKNGFLLDASIFYEFSKRSKLLLGIEKQIDNASFHFNVNNSNSTEIFKFKLNRLAMFAGYSFKF